MGTPSCNSAIFSKGDNFCDFLFASVDAEQLQKWGQHFNKRVCSYRSKFFLLIKRPLHRREENENGRVASLNGVSLTPLKAKKEPLRALQKL